MALAAIAAMTGSGTINELNHRLAECMAELARALAGEPTSRSGDTWRFRGKGSLAVVVSGRKRGAWHDHEAGLGGDPLGLVAHLHGTSMREALAWSLAWLGDAPRSTTTGAPPRPGVPREALREVAAEDDARKQWSAETARTIWRDAVEAAGTLAERYLAARGLRLPADAPLRFHPAAWRNRAFGPPAPAMIGLMTEPETAAPCGVHVTYLRPDGSGKAEGGRPKVMFGAVGVIRLVPDDEVTLGLGLAEGIETALAVMQRAGWSPVWAATSAGAMARFPVLAGIEALTLFADADGPGLDAARGCAGRWAAAGREAQLLVPPKGDWNDALPAREGAA